VLRAGETDDVAVAASIEEHAPEPFSDYYGYESDTIVLVAAGEDGRARIPAETSSGVIVLGIEGAAPNARIPERLRGALVEVRDDSGAVVLKAPDAIASRYPAPNRGALVSPCGTGPADVFRGSGPRGF
jgi:hypothetical protein